MTDLDKLEKELTRIGRTTTASRVILENKTLRLIKRVRGAEKDIQILHDALNLAARDMAERDIRLRKLKRAVTHHLGDVEGWIKHTKSWHHEMKDDRFVRCYCSNGEMAVALIGLEKNVD
jgi:hypothetical protein